MVYLTIRAKVTDFAKWRSVFDESEGLRRAAGSTGLNHVYRDVDDPNTVTLMLEWDNTDNAHKFMNDPALRERQQKAGVVGPPAVSAILSLA